MVGQLEADAFEQKPFLDMHRSTLSKVDVDHLWYSMCLASEPLEPVRACSDCSLPTAVAPWNLPVVQRYNERLKSVEGGPSKQATLNCMFEAIYGAGTGSVSVIRQRRVIH